MFSFCNQWSNIDIALSPPRGCISKKLSWFSLMISVLILVNIPWACGRHETIIFTFGGSFRGSQWSWWALKSGRRLLSESSSSTRFRLGGISLSKLLKNLRTSAKSVGMGSSLPRVLSICWHRLYIMSRKSELSCVIPINLAMAIVDVGRYSSTCRKK